MKEEPTLKIVQIVTHLNIHDAIGNEILAMDEVLKQQGYDSRIMASNIHENLKSKAQPLDLTGFSPEDLVIFHKSAGDKITKKIADLSCKKAMVYHNITPARYYLCYDLMMFLILSLGRFQLRRHASRMDACWADSRYNAEELQQFGVKNAAVLPIISRDGNQPNPDRITEQTLKAKKGARLLYLGRIAPNKKPEDVIKAYTVFKDKYDPDAVLYLLGSWTGMEKYYAKLKGFAADLNLTDEQVVFAGRVTDEEREAYLRNADVLLCLSEHEGFCVPLLEAADRGLPVLAYNAAAVPETLGDNGLLFSRKDYEAMADAIAKLRTDEGFRDQVIQKEKRGLKRFDQTRSEQQFLELLAGMTGKQSEQGTAPEKNPEEDKPEETIPQSIPPKRRTESGSFKPLWRIHNSTYRRYARGTRLAGWKRAAAKVLGILK